MTAEEALKQGDLTTALDQLQNQIRRNPADPKQRVFLFQLLAILGQWDRAMTQLNVAGELDAGNLAMVATYRDALLCEALRSQVFAGQRQPLIFGEPSRWTALLLEALRLSATGQEEAAKTLRLEAFDLAPATAGTINGQSFSWIADADTRIGPMLEAVVNGRYYWLPFAAIQSIQLEPPSDLRDLVWIPAHLTWINAGESVALLPVRYPGSEQQTDTRLALARQTDWLEQEDDLFIGIGQRMLATDEGEYPLLEIERIEL